MSSRLTSIPNTYAKRHRRGFMYVVDFLGHETSIHGGGYVQSSGNLNLIWMELNPTLGVVLRLISAHRGPKVHSSVLGTTRNLQIAGKDPLMILVE